MKAVGAVSTL